MHRLRSETTSAKSAVRHEKPHKKGSQKMHKNRKKGLVLFTSLLVGLTLVPDAGRTVAADSLSGLGGDAASTDDARFRREVGLRADAGYMDQLERREREGTGSFDRSYGALLTDEEAGELRERNDQATANAAVVRSYFGESNPLDAGMFLDNRDGVLTVLVTGQAERVTSDLRATVPHAERLRVSTARTSLAALDDLTGRVSEDIGALREQGIEVTSVSTDQRTNTVTVGVAQATARIRSALERRYAGAPITVVEVSSMPTGTTGRNPPA